MIKQVINAKLQMSRHMGKPTICIGENKGPDQLRSNLKPKFQGSSFSVLVQVGLCQTCSETTLLVFPRDGSNETALLLH